jgi:hypothetical protein
MVYVAELPWSPNPLCPPHIVPILEQAVLALPHSFLIPLAIGELFENKEDCLKRLRAMLCQSASLSSTKASLSISLYQVSYH